MWFGAKPVKSRAAPMQRPLTDAEIVKQRQRQIQQDIARFVTQEKNRNELLADRIQDLVNTHSTNNNNNNDHETHHHTTSNSLLPSIGKQHQQSSGDFLQANTSSSTFPINSNNFYTFANNDQNSGSSSINNNNSNLIHQTLQRSPLDRRLASRVTIDVLHSCSNVVKGIDTVMMKNAESKAKANMKNALNSNANGTSSTTTNSSKTNDDDSNANNNTSNIPLGDGKPTHATTTFGGSSLSGGHHGGGRSSRASRAQHGGSSKLLTATAKSGGGILKGSSGDALLDQEELEEDMRKLRVMCQEDCYLEDDECSVDGGYGTDPQPAQLGPVSSVMVCVSEMKEDAKKIRGSTEEMVKCLDECISLKKDMITMRRFKRNCMRTNYHARKVTQWANQSRTHMFIFNNTINQIGRDAASDLSKGKGRKQEQRGRTVELLVKLREAEDELARVKKETESLVEVHGDVERKLLDAYRARMEEKASSSLGNTASNLDVTGTFGASSISNALLGASSNSPLGKSSNSSAGQQQSMTNSAAQRAFDRMSISAVELYLLLNRLMLLATTNSSTPMPQTVQSGIKRIMVTIEQSIDIEKLDHAEF